MIVFSHAAGQVVSFSDPALPAIASVRLEDWGGFDVLRSLISRVGVGGQCSHQFLHTLGGDIFVYSFGDRIGRLVVSGVSFDNVCGDGAGGELGIEQVIRYYNTNRMSVRRTPLKLAIGVATTLRGYLDAVNVDSVDPVARIWEFSFHISLIPDPIPKIPGGGDEEENLAEDEEADQQIESPGDYGYLPDGNEFDDVTRDQGGQVRGSDNIVPATISGYSQHGTGPATKLTTGHAL